MKKQFIKVRQLLVVIVLLGGFSGCGRKSQIYLETEYNSGFSAGENEALGETAETGESVWVHVCGAVMCPGVYELQKGSRIYEAVEAAGGMAEGAAADYLNMAESLTDGSKVFVPYASDLPEEEQFGSLKEETDGPVDINHAGKELLMSLPGIGEARAEAIIAYRETHGAFEKPEDIMKVSGIKEAAYEKMKDKITVR